MSLQSLKYSAILTTYNSQESVVQALRSINSQLIPPTQIIIVDDASSDSTVEIIRREIIKNFNTTLFVNEENRGQSWGRNLGAQMAGTEYLLFFDDDDASLPNRSTIHLNHLINGSKTSYVSSKKIYSKNYAVTHINSDLAASVMNFETAFKLIFLGQELSPVVKIAVPSCTLAVEREAFLRIGGFDIQLKRLEDMDFFLKCVQNNYQINWSSEIGVLRYHSEGADKSFGQDSKYEALLIDRYGPFVEKKTYLQAKNLASLRLIYFSRKFLLTIPFLARNPSAFRIISKKVLQVTRRLIHERNIRATN